MLAIKILSSCWLIAAQMTLLVISDASSDKLDPQFNNQNLENVRDGSQPFRHLAVLSLATSVKIVTATVTLTSKSICVSLINVTGACQRRRRGIEEKPIILSFDEDDDIDFYNPSSVQR